MRLWLGGLLLLGSVVLGILLASVPRSVVSEQLYYEGFVFAGSERVGEGFVAWYDIMLAAPGRAAYTFYCSNSGGNPVRVAVLGPGGEELFSAVVPPRGRSMIGTLVLSGAGSAVVRVTISGPAGSLAGCDLSIAASGEPGRWLLGLVLGGLLLLPVYWALFTVGGPWVRAWLPGYAGALLGSFLVYYGGAPRPVAVSVDGAAFHAYFGLVFWARPAVVVAAVLAIIVGSLASYYPRGSGWDAGEVVLGEWGPPLVARRLLAASLGAAATLLVTVLALSWAGGVLGGLTRNGDLDRFLLFVLRDAACMLALFLGLGTLAAGAAFASRAPLLVLVVGVLLVYTVASPPCTLAIGGYGTATGYRLDLQHYWKALRYYSTALAAGLALFLAGWLRR